jgi:hypothetical protein
MVEKQDNKEKGKEKDCNEKKRECLYPDSFGLKVIKSKYKEIITIRSGSGSHGMLFPAV